MILSSQLAGLRPCPFSLGDTLKKYAVMINVDGDPMYVSGKNPFTIHDEPLYFDTVEEAEEEASRWNTAMIVELTIEKEKLH